MQENTKSTLKFVLFGFPFLTTHLVLHKKVEGKKKHNPDKPEDPKEPEEPEKPEKPEKPKEPADKPAELAAQEEEDR